MQPLASLLKQLGVRRRRDIINGLWRGWRGLLRGHLSTRYWPGTMDSLQPLRAGPHLVKCTAIHYQSLGPSFITERGRGGLAGNRCCPLCILAVQQGPVTCHYYNRRCVPSSHWASICYHSPSCQSGAERCSRAQSGSRQCASCRGVTGEGQEPFCSRGLKTGKGQ